MTSNSPMPHPSGTEASECCQVSPETRAALLSPNTDTQQRSQLRGLGKALPQEDEEAADRLW